MTALIAGGRLGAPLNQSQIGADFKTKTVSKAHRDLG